MQQVRVYYFYDIKDLGGKMILTLLSLIVMVFLILTKLYDCLTTIKGIERMGCNCESNPFARYLMNIVGMRTTVWLIFLLVVLIAVFAEAISLFIGKVALFLYIILGIFVSIVQYGVAHKNSTGKDNSISKMVYKIYSFRIRKR